jgi:Secretion system C-terminal sorting domain
LNANGTITVLPALTSINNATICNNENLVINGTTYNTLNPTGTEIFTNIGVNGCDSTVTVNLNVLPALIGNNTTTICNNENLVINGTTYNAANSNGTEIFTNIGANGCDSTVTVNLNVLTALTGTNTATICNNENLVINGTTYNASNPTGTEIFMNIGVNGCDSTVTVNLIVLPASTGTNTSTICNNENLVINGTTYNASNPTGTEIFTNIGANGCDSTVTVNLNVLPAINTAITAIDGIFSATTIGATYQWINCGLGNSPIAGATNQSFTPTVNGSYAVIVSNATCSDTSICQPINNVSLIDQTLFSSVSIVPNPTAGMVTISSQFDASYLLLNAQGKVLNIEMKKEKNHTVDISQQPTGIYFVKVIIDGNDKTFKVVKM